MPNINHTKTAEAHDSAAKIHRTAADQHQKGDHKADAEQSANALKLSEAAFDSAKNASVKSKAAAQ